MVDETIAILRLCAMYARRDRAFTLGERPALRESEKNDDDFAMREL